MTKSPARSVGLTSLFALLFLAANLRAPITGIGPVLDQIQNSYHLSAAQAGLLTTLPLLLLGMVSPLVPRVARVFGYGKSVTLALLCVASGLLFRSLAGMSGLYVGTAVLGIGIAIGNVLLPSLIKRDFTQHVATVTGFSALAMGVAAAVVSATAVPLSQYWSWQGALLSVLLLPLLAALLLLSTRRKAVPNSVPSVITPVTHPTPVAIWRTPIAWQVTFYMGINSTLYYIMVAWLPAILQTQGISAEQSGTVHGMMQLATAVPGLFLGLIMSRLRDQVAVAVTLAVMMGVALVGLICLPHWATLWMVLFGIGSGGVLIVSFTFMSLRVSSVQQAAALSGMAQAVGYLLAAGGPVFVGAAQPYLSSWATLLVVLALLSLLMAVCGGLAGRDRVIH